MWYADYPEHYAGDARPATAEKGRILRDLSVQALEKGFFEREAKIRE